MRGCAKGNFSRKVSSGLLQKLLGQKLSVALGWRVSDYGELPLPAFPCSQASGTAETLPLHPYARMMGEWFVRHRRMCRLQTSFRTVNSPISCTERHGSRSDGVSAVPSAYEACPLEPCKGSIRQRTGNRPARLSLRRERDKHPNHTPDPKIFGGYNSAKPSWANLPKANVAGNLRKSLCDFAELAHAPILSKKGSLMGAGQSPAFTSSQQIQI